MQLLLLLFQCSRFVGILKHVSWLRRKRTFLESFETQSIMNNRLFRGFFCRVRGSSEHLLPVLVTFVVLSWIKPGTLTVKLDLAMSLFRVSIVFSYICCSDISRNNKVFENNFNGSNVIFRICNENRCCIYLQSLKQ